MAVLSALDRTRVWAEAMRRPAMGAVPNVLKADLKAAVDTTDQWIDDNAASYNSALPLAFRTNATAAQKTLLFCYVAMRRVGIDMFRTQDDV